MIRKSNSFLNTLLSCACLVSGSATASPITDLDKQIVSEKPGSILSLEQQDVTSLFPHADQRLLVNYRSRGIQGEAIVASAFILLPKGTPPKNGWPVLAWAHGTTGVADTCAPSGDYVGGPVHSYQEVASKALDAWLARGYAVVAPDYQGLGTLGAHPYMNAKSQLHTVVDAVRALHVLKPKNFNKQWLVMGHSQGGAAAIAVSAYGQKDAPELDLKGAIALAPGGYQYEGIAEYVKTNPNPEPSVAAFFPIVLLGAQAAEPSIVPENLVSPEMNTVLTQARSRCLSELQTDLKKSPSSIFRPNADLKPLLAYLKQQSIENMVPTVPLMIVQGSKDHLVDPRGTSAYYQQLCKLKKPTIYQTIDGGDHRDALRQSNTFATHFLNIIEKNETKSYCSTSK